MKPRPRRLKQAQAYWRLAAKARKAGQWKSAEEYQKRGDTFHRHHQAEKRL